MSHGLLLTFEITILVLAIFLGFEVISKVPTLLHTPLMSGTNAIHGIVIVGAMLVAGMAGADTLTGWIGFVAMILAAFLGVQVISKVPTLLHTPLMSGTNAIHGIVIVGALIVAGSGDQDTVIRVIGFVAVALAAANVVGGFVVTDRMLEMFKKREPPRGPDAKK